MASKIQNSLATETDATKVQEKIDSIAEWHSMLIRDKDGASDANKLEIQKQIDAITAAGGSNDVLRQRIEQNNRELRTRGINPAEIET